MTAWVHQALRGDWRRRLIVPLLVIVGVVLIYIIWRQWDTWPWLKTVLTGVVTLVGSTIITEFIKMELPRRRGSTPGTRDEKEEAPQQSESLSPRDRELSTIRETIELLEQANQTGENHLRNVQHQPIYTMPGSIEEMMPGMFRGPQAIAREEETKAGRERVGEAIGAARATARRISDVTSRSAALTLTVAMDTFFLTPWSVSPDTARQQIRAKRGAYGLEYRRVIALLGERWHELSGEGDVAKPAGGGSTTTAAAPPSPSPEPVLKPLPNSTPAPDPHPEPPSAPLPEDRTN